MKLTCPNCDAQYEIEDELIPAEGREVECSGCNHLWFETPKRPTSKSNDTVDRPAPSELPQASEPDITASPQMTSSGLNPDVAEILREEAAHERRLREHAERMPTETTPTAAAQPAKPEATQPAPSQPEPAKPEPENLTRNSAEAASQSLPDPKPVKVTLQPFEPWPDDDLPSNEARRRSGFRWGFLLVALLAGLAVAAYFIAPQLDPATNAQLAGSAARYVDWVDRMRAQVFALFTEISSNF